MYPNGAWDIVINVFLGDEPSEPAQSALHGRAVRTDSRTPGEFFVQVAVEDLAEAGLDLDEVDALFGTACRGWEVMDGKKIKAAPPGAPEPLVERRHLTFFRPRNTHGDDSGLELLGAINEETGELEPITPDEWRRLQRKD